MVEVLLKKHANPNIKNKYGNTALKLGMFNTKSIITNLTINIQLLLI